MNAPYGIDPSTGEPLPPRPYPKRCPMCGSEHLSFDLADWFSHSLAEGDLNTTERVYQ